MDFYFYLKWFRSRAFHLYRCFNISIHCHIFLFPTPLFLLSDHQITSLGTRSKAFSRCTNTLDFFGHLVFFHQLSHYEDSIRHASSRHETHLYFIQFHNFPKPSLKKFFYSLSYHALTVLCFCNFHKILHLFFL